MSVDELNAGGLVVGKTYAEVFTAAAGLIEKYGTVTRTYGHRTCGFCLTGAVYAAIGGGDRPGIGFSRVKYTHPIWAFMVDTLELRTPKKTEGAVSAYHDNAHLSREEAAALLRKCAETADSRGL